MTSPEPPATNQAPTILETVTDQAPAWPPVRHPFQISAMNLFVILGVGWLVNDPSAALRELMGDPLIYVWAWVILISGVSGIVSAIFAVKDEGLSLLTERLALVGIGGFTLVYLVALIIDKGITIWVTEMLFATYLYACAWRYRQVRKRIKWNKKVGRASTPRWRP